MVLDTVHERLASIGDAKIDASRWYLFLVSTSHMATAEGEAKAVATLLESEVSGFSGPMERALYELFIDFKYMLNRGTPNDNAFKVLVNGTLEVLSFLKKHELDYQESEEGMRRVLDNYRAERADLVAEVERQRSERKFHWSGLSRSGLEREFWPNSTIYTGLSWEAHSALDAVRDIHIKDGHMVFARRPDPFRDPELRADMTAGILFQMWNEYARIWDLTPLPRPSGAA